MDPARLAQSDPHSRPKPFTFRPPKNNRLVIALVKLILPRVIRQQLKVTEIEVNGEDLEKLRALKGKRCLLTPSHSGGYEPHIIMHLSKVLSDDYNYLAAMEVFEKSPITGWLLQRLGAYSIIRASADRPSFQMTKQLLVDKKRWLVIFPEGQTVWQNDTVMPFQEGVIQLAFKAYEQATKEENDPCLFCVPIAIKYVYLKDMHGEIDASLTRLESNLFAADNLERQKPYERLRRIGEAVLTANEKKHHVKLEKGATYSDRMQQMKERIVTHIEQELEVTPRETQSLLDRIRTLFNLIDRIVQDEPVGSEYERQLMRERQQEVRTLYDDLWRVLQFVAIYDGYVRECMTVERFMDVLNLLEMEVFKVRRIWGPRKAQVKVGKPVNLREYFSSYKADKHGAFREVTLTLESSIRQMLQSLSAGRKVAEVD